MTMDIKNKVKRVKHPINGGQSKFTLFIAYMDNTIFRKLSVAFPEDELRELISLNKSILNKDSLILKMDIFIIIWTIKSSVSLK